MKPFDLTGQVFGKWTVIRDAPYSFTSHKRMWFCICKCGNVSNIPTGDLRNGESKSCQNCKRKTHGLTGSKEYWIWHGMKKRCSDRNGDGWRLYGGRGIKVCERWRDSFSDFLSDMGKCPEGHSIERINNDGNYEPLNCKWVTPREQARNRSTNRMVEIGGDLKCAADWAKIIGLSKSGFLYRLKTGISGIELLKQPKKVESFA